MSSDAVSTPIEARAMDGLVHITLLTDPPQPLVMTHEAALVSGGAILDAARSVKVSLDETPPIETRSTTPYQKKPPYVG